MSKVKDVLWDLGDTTACYARDIGDKTSALARRVGPKRGGIALGILAVAIATPFLIRWLRARSASELEAEDFDETSAVPRRRYGRRTPRAASPFARS